MAHFNLDNQINEVTRMDAAFNKGPLMRWQRKALEASMRSQSGESLNASTSLSASCMEQSMSKCGTPGRMPCSPSRSNVYVDRLPGGRTKTPTRSRTPGRESKTPNKNGPSTPHNQCDRFIPNRAAMDVEASSHLLLNENINPDDPTMSPGTAEQQRRIAVALKQGQPEKAKILSFQQKPKPEEGHVNNLRVLYNGKTSSAVKKPSTTRFIPSAPERILDAPELLDDFYLNLLSWSANNHLAVSLGQCVYLWNACTGSIDQLMELEQPEEYISSVSWIPKEGNVLALGTSTGTVQLWDVTQQKLMRIMSGHVSRIGCMSWNDYILSSGSRSGQIHHHDVRSADHHVATLSSHTQEVCGLEWSLDGRYLASGANDNVLCVWGKDLGHEVQPIHSFTQHQAAVKALAWCPWQPSLLASGGGTADRHIRFWNVSTGACINSVDTNSQVSCLAWNKDYKEIISGHGFSQFQLTLWKYQPNNLTKIQDLHGHTARILCMAQSPDGSTVVSAAADETLRLWKCWQVDKKAKAGAAKSKEKPSLLSKGIR